MKFTDGFWEIKPEFTPYYASQIRDFHIERELESNSVTLYCPFKRVVAIFVLSIVILLFFGGIGITKLAGLYQVTPPKITSETKMTTDEIKGYMTLQEVSQVFNIDLNELYKKLNIPDTIPKETKLKEVKNYVPDFEVEQVREILK